MAPAETDQPASNPTAGWQAMAAVALIATAVAANLAWIFASQGLGEPAGVFFERLLALLAGSRAAVSVAGLAAGAAGAFLLYAARWQAMLGGPGLAGHARRRVLVARVLLSAAVSAVLVAIPAHGFIPRTRKVAAKLPVSFLFARWPTLIGFSPTTEAHPSG